ncbi:MAG: hypothetical protein GKR90_17745 [Pseudomonadales bacterium]|nr:hypothetical protein [Pseudomonadales bacterium]
MQPKILTTLHLGFTPNELLELTAYSPLRLHWLASLTATSLGSWTVVAQHGVRRI